MPYYLGNHKGQSKHVKGLRNHANFVTPTSSSLIMVGCQSLGIDSVVFDQQGLIPRPRLGNEGGLDPDSGIRSSHRSKKYLLVALVWTRLPTVTLSMGAHIVKYLLPLAFVPTALRPGRSGAIT